MLLHKKAPHMSAAHTIIPLHINLLALTHVETVVSLKIR
jgi:hypothetical protein